jgi:ABC-type transport system substrate-binding protein
MRLAREGRSGRYCRAACLLACVLGLSLSPGVLQTGAQERQPVVDGGVYRRPLGHDPATLDPARLRDIYSLAVGQQLFDGLVQFDQTLSITPALAQFWIASRDGLTWTFTLRKGVKFHHGREVTADDVVYSFTRLLDPRL